VLALQALAWAVVVAAIAFWITYALDRWWHFSLGVREVLGLAGCAAFLIALGRCWGQSISRPLSLPQLALLVERAYPETRELLVTAAEIDSDGSVWSPDVGTYYRVFAHDVLRQAEQWMAHVRLRRIIRFRNVLLAFLVALLAGGSVVGFGWYTPGEWTVWYSRWVQWEDRPWPVRTGLVVQDFYRGQMVLSKGAAVEVVAAVDLSMPHVPRVVRLKVRDVAGLQRDTWMLREATGGVAKERFQRHFLRVAEVFEPLQLSIWAGDCRIGPLEIVPVEPPGLRAAVAECVYPAYLRREVQKVDVLGTLAVPEGTDIRLQLQASRPTVRVRIKQGERIQEYQNSRWQELERLFEQASTIFQDFLGGKVVAELADRQREWLREFERVIDSVRAGEALGTLRPGLETRHSVSHRGLGGAVGSAELFDEVLGQGRQVYESLSKFELGQEGPPWQVALIFRQFLARLEELLERQAVEVASDRWDYSLGRLVEPVELAIWFMDVQRISNHQPIVLRLTPVGDQSPKFNVDLQGVGRAVTPTAFFEVAGEVSDDHGLRQIWVEVKSTGSAGEGSDRSPPVTLADFPSPVAKWKLKSRVELSAFRPTPATKLSIQIAARDWCDLHSGPHEARSPTWIVEVVTPDELRVQLEKREILLRQQLDQIITELNEAQGILGKVAALVREKSSERIEKGAEGTSISDAASKLNRDGATGDSQTSDFGAEECEGAQRRLLEQFLEQINKNTHEVAAVLGGVTQIRQEILHNRLDLPPWLRRLQSQIEPPLEEASRRVLPKLLETVKAELDGPWAGSGRGNLPTRVDEAFFREVANELAVAIDLLRQARDAMLQLEDIRQLAEFLRQILENQQAILESTREEHRRRLRQILEGRP
jgi:hypothetical protein